MVDNKIHRIRLSGIQTALLDGRTVEGKDEYKCSKCESVKNETVAEISKVNIFSTPIEEPVIEETPTFMEEETKEEEKEESDFDFAVPYFLRKR